MKWKFTLISSVNTWSIIIRFILTLFHVICGVMTFGQSTDGVVLFSVVCDWYCFMQI